MVTSITRSGYVNPRSFLFPCYLIQAVTRTQSADVCANTRANSESYYTCDNDRGDDDDAHLMMMMKMRYCFLFWWFTRIGIQCFSKGSSVHRKGNSKVGPQRRHTRREDRHANEFKKAHNLSDTCIEKSRTSTLRRKMSEQIKRYKTSTRYCTGTVHKSTEQENVSHTSQQCNC